MKTCYCSKCKLKSNDKFVKKQACSGLGRPDGCPCDVGRNDQCKSKICDNNQYNSGVGKVGPGNTSTGSYHWCHPQGKAKRGEYCRDSSYCGENLTCSGVIPKCKSMVSLDD
jgi:hypothetical protein